MILLLDTSSPECCVYLAYSLDEIKEYRWQAGRELAKGLLSYIDKVLGENNLRIQDLTGIGFYRGPGSFTGLRIGAATCNAIAYAEGIAVVGATGEDWIQVSIKRLNDGENDKVVLPDYGRPARITAPRK